jgi:hypothetical protein
LNVIIIIQLQLNEVIGALINAQTILLLKAVKAFIIYTKRSEKTNGGYLKINGITCQDVTPSAA